MTRHTARPAVRACARAALALLASLGAAAALAAPQPIPTTGPSPFVAPAAPVDATAKVDLAVAGAPTRQLLQQLASATGWNIIPSQDIAGDVTITLRNASVPQVLEALRMSYGYDFRVDGTTAYVYGNMPQTVVYRVNYLPGRREGRSELRVSSSAIMPSASGGTSDGGSGSNGGPGGGAQRGRNIESAEVRTSSDADFWREVQASLRAIVGLDDSPAPAVVAAAAPAAGGPGAGGPGIATRSPEGMGSATAGTTAGNAAAAAAAAAATMANRRSVTVNQSAGLLIVRATLSEHEQVRRYLDDVKLSVERQVMLEAKIIEVTLSSDSQTGINWAGFGRVPGTRGQLTAGSAAPGTRLGGTGALTTADQTIINAGTELVAGAVGRGFYGLAFQAANFAALLNFLQTQGDVQVLSSPRIATLNNTKAVLKVGADELFVTGVSTTTTASASGNVTTPSVQLQPFFSGISLDVTPQIDGEGNVTLHVHPAISNVAEKSKVIDLGALGSLKLPLATSAINETDSVVRVKDGQIVALGGLMRHVRLDEKTGLPVLQDIPVVGGAFRQTTATDAKRELVVLLKPTILSPDRVWPVTASDDLAGLGGAALSVIQPPRPLAAAPSGAPAAQPAAFSPAKVPAAAPAAAPAR